LERGGEDILILNDELLGGIVDNEGKELIMKALGEWSKKFNKLSDRIKVEGNKKERNVMVLVGYPRIHAMGR